MATLSKSEIERLFNRLNTKLERGGNEGEIYLVRGAVLCLVFQTRPATNDIDAFFLPASLLRKLADEIAQEETLDKHWLNDAVKGFLSEKGSFNIFAEYSHLRVLYAQPEYLLAMKCLAMRIGEEFHDIDDVRFLLRYLGIDKFENAKQIIKQYYPPERFPQKTLYALEELLGG